VFKKILLSALLLSLFLLSVYIKPLTIYILETSLTSLLETPVKTISFELLKLDLHASIKDEENIAHVKINSLYPLQADVTYDGNIDAFGVYHPLKAPGKLKGTVYYKDHLDIHAQLLCMQANSRVHVFEKGEDWVVDANVSGLDLNTLQKENNIFLEMEGKTDIVVDFHTEEDSIIQVRSPQIIVQHQKYNKVLFEIKSFEDLVQAYAVFKAPNIDYKGIWFNYHEDTNKFDGKIDLNVKKSDNNILVNLKGEHNDTKLIAEVDADIALSSINISDIKYDFNTSNASANVELKLKEIQRHKGLLKELGIDLQGDFNAKSQISYTDKKLLAQVQTQSLGGQFKARFENETLGWNASSLSLKKILYILKIEENIVASLDSEGQLKDEKLKAKLTSQSLQIDKTKLQDIHIQALGKLTDLNFSMRVMTPYANIKKAMIQVKDFQDINLSAQISTPYTKELIRLNSNIEHKESQVHLQLQAKSDELDFKVSDLSYKESKLKGQYTLNLSPELSSLKEKLYVYGGFSYIKDFKLVAHNKDFGGQLKFELEGDQIKLKGTKIQMQRLLSQLKAPPYLSGKTNIYLQGDFDTQSFSLQSDKLSLNKKETGLDENLSIFVKGNVNKNRLFIQPDITNRHLKTSRGDISFLFEEKELFVNLPLHIHNKKKKLNLNIRTQLMMNEEIKGKLEVFSQDDTLLFDDISYKNKDFTTQLKLDVNDLLTYTSFIEQEFHGPLKVNGSIKYIQNQPDINLSTKSFGGVLSLALKKQDLLVKADKLLPTKISYHLKQEEERTDAGIIDGALKYNVKDKGGTLRLRAQDLVVEGIDIDKSLKEIKDILGLNIFAMGDKLIKKRFSSSTDVNLSTHVRQLEFDVDIEPELIISKDIALSTDLTRFAIDADLKPNGDIKDFEVAILDQRGCAILTQKLKGNIQKPSLVDSKGTAVVVLGKAPEEILRTGGRLVNAGAGLVDSAATFIWKKGLRQDSNVTLVDDSLTKGANIFSSSAELVVSGECTPFYTGKVEHPR